MSGGSLVAGRAGRRGFGAASRPWLAGLGASAGAAALIAAGTSPVLIVVAAASVAALLYVVKAGRTPILLAASAVLLLPSTQVTRWAALIVPFALIVGHALLAGRLSSRGAWGVGTVVALHLGLCAWLAFSALRAVDARSAAGVLVLGAALPVFGVAWAAVGGAVGVRVLATGIIAATGAASVIALARLALNGNLTFGAALGYTQVKDSVVGLLGDVNGASFVVMAGVPLAFGILLLEKRGVPSLLAGAVGVLGFATLVFLFTRAALMGATLGCVVVALLAVRRSPLRLLAILGVTAGAVYVLLPGLSSLSSDRGNLTSRQELWATAIDFWRLEPFFGHGPNSWNHLVASYARDAPGGGNGGAHNIILSGLVSGGVVAAALQIALICVVLGIGFGALSSGAETAREVRPVLAGCLGSLVAILTRGMFEATGWPGVRVYDLHTWPGLISWAVVGTILACSYPVVASRRPGGPVRE